MKSPKVYLHTSEHMDEVKDRSVKLLVGASVYLGKKADWSEYAQLYQQVYNKEGLRIIREDGVFVVLQTDAYNRGRYVPRLYNLLHLLLPAGWTLLDRKVWVRQSASLFQVPFSDVMIFAPPNGSVSRVKLNEGNKEWFQGIWHFKPTGEADNAYPVDLCRLLVKSCSDEKDLVVDPFAGSAKLGGVAHALKRRYIGYEIDQNLIPTIQKNGCDVVRHGETLKRKKSGLIL